MLEESQLEHRLATVERALEDLQHRFAVIVPAGDWIAKVTGSISDEAAFLEALEHGKKLRAEGRPEDCSGGQP